MKYSINPKTNAVLNDIEEQLLSIHNNKEDSIKEIFHYAKEFPREVDYNLYQYGNVLIYYYDIRQMYLKAGYKAEKWSCDKLVSAYQRQLRYVANCIMSNAKNPSHE